jgi:hypothetical protein
MIKNLGWGTFLFWGIADLMIAGGAWWCLDETRGRSLEEITHTSDGVKGFGDEREYEREGDGGKGASVEVR